MRASQDICDEMTVELHKELNKWALSNGLIFSEEQTSRIPPTSDNKSKMV